MFFFFVGLLISFAQFAGGDGTESNPYQISTHEHLNNVRNYLDDLDVHFVLINDIDLTNECASGGDYYNYGQGWIPIGDIGGYFSGFFDGNNYAIIGLFIDRPASLQALFANAADAVFINLNLYNVNVSGITSIGSIVGSAYSSMFSNCHVVINFGSALSTSGGIVGCSTNSVFCNCSSEGALYSGISGASEKGGLIGKATGTLILKCYSAVDLHVSSVKNGGLVGSAVNCNIVNCYSRGEVIAINSTLSIAGFAGVNEYGKIINCYSTGRVFFENDNITNVGFIGSFLTGSNFLMSGNYFDMESSEQNSSVGAMERTTDEMTFPYAENTYVDYDFENVWLADSNYNINDGYPYLSDDLSKSVTEWPIALSVNCGESLNDSELSGGESLIDGVFVFDTVNIVFNNPGIYQVPVLYLPSNDYCFQPENSVVDIQVIGTPPVVTEWPMSDAIFCGDELSSATLTGGVANVEGEFTFLYPDSVPQISGNCLSQIVFTPNGGTCYDTLSSHIDVFVDMTNPIITDWPLASSIYCGESLESSVLTGGLASVPGTFVFQDAEIIPDGAGDYFAAVNFIPENPACYNLQSGTVSVFVEYSNPIITQWPNPSAISCGDSLGVSQLNGGEANVSGDFVFDNGSEVSNYAGSYEAIVQFVPDDLNCYNILSTQLNIPVNITIPDILEWPETTDIFCGESFSQTVLFGGSANVPGTFILMDSVSVSESSGVFDLDVCFAPENPMCYDSVWNSIPITVNMSDALVTDWPSASSIYCGESLESSVLTGGLASVPGTFVFQDAEIIPDGAGDYFATVNFIPENPACYNLQSGTVSVFVEYSNPIITQWPNPSAISCGDSLGVSQLNGGEANVSGDFVFDNGSEVSNYAGSYEAIVQFVPDDLNCYNILSTQLNIPVNITIPDILEWPETTDIFCGESFSQTVLFGGSANVPGTFILMDSVSVSESSGVFDLDVCFAPENPMCYDSVWNSIPITVNMSDALVTDWPLASSIYCGESLESSVLTGGLASVPGTFVFQDAEIIPDGAGVISAPVLFVPDNDACYNTLLGNVNVDVNYSTPIVFQWPTADTLHYGDSIGMSSLTGGNANVDGVFELVNPQIIPDNAGVFMAEILFIPNDDNCYSSLTGEIEINVEKALAEIVISDLNHNYDQTEKSVTVTTNPAGLNVLVTYDGNSELPIEVGTYFVEAEIVEQNYYGYASDSMKIHPPLLNISAISFNKYFGDEYVFSGNEYIVSGLFGTDYVESVDLSSTGASASAALGDYPIVVSNAIGQGLENYIINYYDGILTVTDKTILALNNLEIYDKVYDATNEAQIMTFGGLSGIEADDEVFLDTTNYIALFNHKNIGDNKPVYVTGLSLTGADADAYVINSQIGFGDIYPRELNVISAVAHDKVYDGSTDCLISNAELEGVINNENVILSNFALGNFVQDNVGVDITVEVLMTLEGEDASNYTLIQPDYLRADITPKEVFIFGDFTVVDKVYDETTDASLENSGLYPEVIIFGDEVSICNLEIEFTNAGPGDSIPVHIVSASLCGFDASNYYLNTANAPLSSANIFPRKYSLTVDVIGNGDVFVNDTLYSSPLFFDEGTAVDVEADAYEYYRFDKWTHDLFSQNRLESVTMDSNIYIICEFVPNEYSPFHLYPNPFYDEVFITKPEMVDRVIIYSTLGQYVGEQYFDGESFKLSTLGLGMYVLKVIDTNGEIHVFKLVKAYMD
jgi:hypothetical protein